MIYVFPYIKLRVIPALFVLMGPKGQPSPSTYPYKPATSTPKPSLHFPLVS